MLLVAEAAGIKARKRNLYTVPCVMAMGTAMSLQDSLARTSSTQHMKFLSWRLMHGDAAGHCNMPERTQVQDTV